jgi:hypothetical protein
MALKRLPSTRDFELQRYAHLLVEFLRRLTIDATGQNTLAVSLWAHDAVGAKLEDFRMELRAKVESAMPSVVNQPMPGWEARPGA